MKKLKLNLDDLQVESFGTTPEKLGKPGTVYGFDTDQTYYCTYLGGSGCMETCDPHCYHTQEVTACAECATHNPECTWDENICY